MKPSIVFNRLSKCWKQRKCGDVFTESREFGHSGDVAKKLTVKLWGKGVYAKLDQGSANTHYFIRHTGQFIYSKLDFLNSAFGVVNEALDGYESTADMPAFDCHGVNPYFMYYRAIQPSFYITNGMIADGSRKAKRVHAETFLQMPLMLPSIEEQDKIAWFFRKLEDTITIHQRKINSMKRLKKSLLQKMFPQNGECVPEIRFSGFTDSWEQRKLGEIGQCQSGVGFPDAEQGGTTGIPFFKVSDMNNPGNETEMVNANNYVTEEQIARKKWKPITEVPAMFFAKVGAAVLLNRKRLVSFPFLLDNNTMAYKFSSKWDARFGKAVFETIYLPGLAQTGALPSYNARDVENISIFIPATKEEQVRIGGFFKTIDDTITLHQRKALQLQKIKQALLQHMFI